MTRLNQAETGRDALLATPGLAAGGAGFITANDLLIYISIAYMCVLIGYTAYKWWVLHKKVRQWLDAIKTAPDTPPPREVASRPADL